MADVADGYAEYYAQRLWALLPAVYRTDDTDASGAPGPLRELLNRIGGQVAVVRRSIDRLWADQSIETCDDWVIPYIGGLLGTNLVNGLDARGQRLDVAKTIHYRRRKGTLAVLEELARDVTGWDAHVVEGFRRLARTRHGLDPMVGPAAFPGSSPADVAGVLQHEGLTGPLTGTPAGGLADLRSAHDAALSGSPFDESFHMADLRAGRGAVGHFGIQKLLVFLWRLTSFPVAGGTPVQVAGCPGLFTFDPTGRQVPIFLPPAADPDTFADTWTSAYEWQVRGPITRSLEQAMASPATSPPAPPYPFPPPNPDPPPATLVPFGLRAPTRAARSRPTTSTASPERSGPARTTASCSATPRHRWAPRRPSAAAPASIPRSGPSPRGGLLASHRTEGPITACLAPGTYTLTEPLVLGPGFNDLTLQACGPGVLLRAPSQPGPEFVLGLIVVEGATAVTIRGLTLAMPPVRFPAPAGSFSALSDANQSLLAEFSKGLQVLIGISVSGSTTGLTVEDCVFKLPGPSGANRFSAGIFATGAMNDLTIRGCGFLATTAPVSVPFHNLAAGIQSAPPDELAFGYLQVPGITAVAADAAGADAAPPSLHDATIEQNRFEGVTVPTLIMARIGTLRADRNAVRNCYAGFWLFSIAGPVQVLPFFDPIATGDAGIYEFAAILGISALLDRILVIAAAIGQVLPAAPRQAGASSPSRSSRPPRPSRRGLCR